MLASGFNELRMCSIYQDAYQLSHLKWGVVTFSDQKDDDGVEVCGLQPYAKVDSESAERI